MSIFDEIFALQQIDNLIRTRATGSPKDLANRLDISECSVYRLIERLKDQGFPIAYDKSRKSYYYERSVKWQLELIVGDDKIVSVKGGEKKPDYFGRLSNFDRIGNDLCNAFPNIAGRAGYEWGSRDYSYPA